MNNSRYKILIAIIAVLLLSNIAMLAYFVWWKPDGHHGEKRKSPMTEFLQKEIGFSPQQMTVFDSLKQVQMESLKPFFDDLSKSRDTLYQQIAVPSLNDPALQNTVADIGKKQSALELKLFDNFRQIRALCTPDQLPKFDSLAPSQVRKMMSPSRKQASPKKSDSSNATH